MRMSEDAFAKNTVVEVIVEKPGYGHMSHT